MAWGIAYEIIQMAKRYVEQWKKVKAENLGLLLWGDVGTGKSFVAACIANALLEQGIPVLMTNFSKILNQMGAMYSEERYRYIMGCIMGCVIGLIIGCTHDRVSMSDLSTLTAVGNKVDTKIQNCVWDVRRFILLTNLVID